MLSNTQEKRKKGNYEKKKKTYVYIFITWQVNETQILKETNTEIYTCIMIQDNNVVKKRQNENNQMDIHTDKCKVIHKKRERGVTVEKKKKNKGKNTCFHLYICHWRINETQILKETDRKKKYTRIMIQCV